MIKDKGKSIEEMMCELAIPPDAVRKASEACRKDCVQSACRISPCCLVWLSSRGWFRLLSNGHLCLMYVLERFR